jgi:hypothetical protein
MHKLWSGGPENKESRSVEALASSVSFVLSQPLETATSTIVTLLLACSTLGDEYGVLYTKAADSSNSTGRPPRVGRGSVENA